MINKRKVMSELGSASGCVNRCIDILQNRTKITVEALNEIMERLQKADKAILSVAHEIDKEEDA